MHLLNLQNDKKKVIITNSGSGVESVRTVGHESHGSMSHGYVVGLIHVWSAGLG